jgi:hypothetical protein
MSTIPLNLRSLLDGWNGEDIRYCHWKSNEHLVKGMEGKTDLDILVDPAQKEKAEARLVENGYRRVLSHPWNTYARVSDWIGADPAHGQQTHIHLHYTLLTGKQNVKEQYLPWSELTLENRVFDQKNAVWICDPNMEIFILVARIFLKRFDFLAIPRNDRPYAIAAPDAAELAYLRDRLDRDGAAAFACRMFPENLRERMIRLATDSAAWTNRFCRAVKKDLARDLRAYRLSRKAAVEFHSFSRYALQTAGSKTGHKINKKKTIPGGGKLISFLGADGSGKTTVARDIQKWLSWKLDCRYVYLGTGQGKSSFLNRLVRLRGEKKLASQTPKEAAYPEHPPLQGRMPFGKAVRKTLLNAVALSNMKYKYRSVKKIDRWKRKGVVVLTDRFPQDRYPGINDGANVTLTGRAVLDLFNRYLRRREQKKLGLILRYSPDVVIKLIVPLEVSRARKQDSPEQVIQRKIEIVQALHYPQAKEFLVPSDVALEETEDRVKRIVWDNL